MLKEQKLVKTNKSYFTFLFSYLHFTSDIFLNYVENGREIYQAKKGSFFSNAMQS